MTKSFESNMKRLNGIVSTYEEKKGKEVDTKDIKERRAVMRDLKATLKMF